MRFNSRSAPTQLLRTSRRTPRERAVHSVANSRSKSRVGARSVGSGSPSLSTACWKCSRQQRSAAAGAEMGPQAPVQSSSLACSQRRKRSKGAALTMFFALKNWKSCSHDLERASVLPAPRSPGSSNRRIYERHLPRERLLGRRPSERDRLAWTSPLMGHFLASEAGAA